MNHPASGSSHLLTRTGEGGGGVGRSRRLDTDWAVGRSERNSLGRRGGRTTNASTFRLDSYGERRRILSEP